MFSKPRRVSAALLCALFLVVLYRAKTQSYTIDEARTYELYVNQPLSAMAISYDACNHVLHTLITKFFRSWLGYSELVLRIASLLGCALYFTATYRICSLLFETQWIHPLAAAVLTLNPLVLDFMVASRGYGLALGLFWWALYYAIRMVLGAVEGRLLWRTGVLCGLAVSANLTFVVPVTALGGMLGLVAMRRGGWRSFDQFIGPLAVIAFVLNVLPLARAQRDNFYVGSQTWRSAVETFFNQSLLSSPDRALIQIVGGAVRDWTRDYGVALAFAVLVAGGAIAFAHILISRRGVNVSGLGIVATLLGASVLALTLMKSFAGVLYPHARTGLYLLPLFTLSLVSAIHLFSSRSVFRYAGYAFLMAFAAAYISQLETRYFIEWKFDASTKELTKRVAADYAVHPLKSPVRVGATWTLQPSLDFYRKRQHLHWMEQINRQELETEPFDYYVLVGDDTQLVRKLGLRVLYTDRLSGAVVARRA